MHQHWLKGMHGLKLSPGVKMTSATTFSLELPIAVQYKEKPK